MISEKPDAQLHLFDAMKGDESPSKPPAGADNDAKRPAVRRVTLRERVARRRRYKAFTTEEWWEEQPRRRRRPRRAPDLKSRGGSAGQAAKQGVRLSEQGRSLPAKSKPDGPPVPAPGSGTRRRRLLRKRMNPKRFLMLLAVAYGLGAMVLFFIENPDVRALLGFEIRPESDRKVRIDPSDLGLDDAPSDTPAIVSVDPASLPSAASYAREMAAKEKRFASLLDQADSLAGKADVSALETFVGRALDEAGDRPDVLVAVGSTLSVMPLGATPEARATRLKALLPIYERVARESVGMPEPLVRAADYFAAAGDLDEARRLYIRADDLSADSPEVTQRLSQFAMQMGLRDEALASLKNWPVWSPMIRLFRGISCACSWRPGRSKNGTSIKKGGGRTRLKACQSMV